jgi:hypothetical protein
MKFRQNIDLDSLLSAGKEESFSGSDPKQILLEIRLKLKDYSM